MCTISLIVFLLTLIEHNMVFIYLFSRREQNRTFVNSWCGVTKINICYFIGRKWKRVHSKAELPQESQHGIYTILIITNYKLTMKVSVTYQEYIQYL